MFKWPWLILSLLGIACNAQQNNPVNTAHTSSQKDKLIKKHSSLADALMKARASIEKETPETLQLEIEHMIQSLAANSDSALKEGEVFPISMLQSPADAEQNQAKTSVIVWIRGAWCPYSALILEDLNRYAKDFDKLRIPLIVLSTDSQKNLDKLKATLGLTYDIVSDYGGKIAGSSGLTFQLNPAISNWYQKLYKYSPSDHEEKNLLSLHATYILDSNGTVKKRFIHADHRSGTETAELLQAAAAITYNVVSRQEGQYRPLSQFEKWVIEEKGTERAYTGEYWDHKEKGVYVCRKCNNPMYVSSDKFDSHCGWPSFDDEISNSVIRKLDADGYRTEIICANCLGHLGHVFEGERFTEKNIRHCVNSVSVRFIPYP